MRKRLGIYKKSRRGRNDWHRQAAEFHDLAAHAHRVAAAHQEQQDHRTGHELSKLAMEYSAKAYEFAKKARPTGTAKPEK